MNLLDILLTMTPKEKYTLLGYAIFAFVGIVGVARKLWTLDHEDSDGDDNHGHGHGH